MPKDKASATKNVHFVLLVTSRWLFKHFVTIGSGESGDFEVVEPQTGLKCTEFGCVWGL